MDAARSYERANRYDKAVELLTKNYKFDEAAETVHNYHRYRAVRRDWFTPTRKLANIKHTQR